VIEQTRLFLRQGQHLPCPVSEALEHAASVPFAPWRLWPAERPLPQLLAVPMTVSGPERIRPVQANRIMLAAPKTRQ
jgi:hypothetical protein